MKWRELRAGLIALAIGFGLLDGCPIPSRGHVPAWELGFVEPLRRVRDVVELPVAWLGRVFAVSQQFSLYQAPIAERFRMWIEGQDAQHAWRLLYRAGDPEHREAADLIEHARVWGAWNPTDAPPQEYGAFCAWISMRLLAAHPELIAVRVRQERIAIGQGEVIADRRVQVALDPAGAVLIARWWRRWVAWLDREEPATALALVRILLALVLLVDYVGVWRAGLIEPLYTRRPDGFALGEAWLSAHAAWALGTVSLALIVVGAATRAACIGFALASAALSHLTPDAESGLDMLARVVFVILALSRCNALWSIDAWIARRLGREVPILIPAWPRYLLLLQLVWVYFSGGINKSAAAWGPFGGFTALANALGDPHAARFDPGWLAAVYPLTRIATVVTMAFELGAPLLFLLAYLERWRIRWVWIALGVGFEVGIAVGLRLGSFPYGMLALYPVLLGPEDYERLKARVPAKRASPPS